MKKTKKPKVQWRLINKAEFITARYENFLRKKKWLIENLGETWDDFVVMSDLDRVYEGETKPLKELVVCDRCNEYIEDEEFIMFEESRVYHKACIEHQLPKDFFRPGRPVDEVGNLFYFDEWVKEQGGDK